MIESYLYHREDDVGMEPARKRLEDEFKRWCETKFLNYQVLEKVRSAESTIAEKWTYIRNKEADFKGNFRKNPNASVDKPSPESDWKVRIKICLVAGFWTQVWQCINVEGARGSTLGSARGS